MQRARRNGGIIDQSGKAADAAFTPYFALSQHDRSRLSYVAEIDLTGEETERLPVGIPVQVTFPDLEP